MSQRLHFVASKTEEAQAALNLLRERYGDVGIDSSDVIVALGGDGFMLQTLHRRTLRNLPVYGMKLGTVGFLMNQYHVDALDERIACAADRAAAARDGSADRIRFRRDGDGIQRSLAAAPDQAGRARARVAQRCGEARGTRLRRHPAVIAGRFDRVQPVGARTDSSARFQRARDDADQPVPAAALACAILPSATQVRFEVLDHYKRPVSATADSYEVRDIVEVTIRESRERVMNLLFDPEHNLEDRILNEQFEV